MMDIETEDFVSVMIILMLLVLQFLTILKFNSPLLSITILWIGMTLISVGYSSIYKRKNRNMRILKIRFLVSVVIAYPFLIYQVYRLSTGCDLPREQQLLPFCFVLSILILNAIVAYISRRKKQYSIYRDCNAYFPLALFLLT